MKSIPVQEAIGLTLCHDITEIVPEHSKGTAFKRGHIIREQDIQVLLRLGKEHIYVWENQPTAVHEDDAARRIAKAAAGPGVSFGEPHEGRINLKADYQGLLKINLDLLDRINSINHITLATIHNGQEVSQGRMIAGTRVIPLTIPEVNIQAVEECCAQENLLTVLPFAKYKVGIVTTGSEIYHGRVKDGFGPVLRKKFSDWGSEIVSQTIVPDEPLVTQQAVEEAIANGAELIVVSGGMSVDPDDKTPAAIRSLGCEIICYGVPIFPGAMFMLGYKNSIPILGLPGCVMYHQASIFDLVMPRILAGERITRQDILRLAHGGLCENCLECHFPVCAFGKAK